jgi:uncharacterized protein YndB with AHSA1/START domain
VVRAEADVAAPVDSAFTAITHVERWWESSHTYSGDARNLRLEPRAGGCWCERWSGGSVKHMDVAMVSESRGARTIRLIGGLGPLQSMGVNGVMTFTITPLASGAKITMEYRVAGDASLQLDQIGSGVDDVLMEQFARLIRYTGSGSPE